MSYLGPNQPGFNLIAHFCTASAQITKKFDYLPLDSLARSLLPKTSAAMSQSSLPPTLRIKFRYANILRCIGQSLESVDLKALELKLQGDTYVVQAWHRGTSSSMNFERQYSLEDIKKLEIEGREKRHSFPGPVNLLSLSQVLRLAGNYVDRAYGRLVRVSWQDQSDRIQSITVQYEPCQTEQAGDAQTITIDEICLHVYKQRKKIARGAEKHFHRPAVTSTAVSEPARPPVDPPAD